MTKCFGGKLDPKFSSKKFTHLRETKISVGLILMVLYDTYVADKLLRLLFWTTLLLKGRGDGPSYAVFLSFIT